METQRFMPEKGVMPARASVNILAAADETNRLLAEIGTQLEFISKLLHSKFATDADDDAPPSLEPPPPVAKPWPRPGQ